jgi:hypothetical protein
MSSSAYNMDQASLDGSAGKFPPFLQGNELSNNVELNNLDEEIMAKVDWEQVGAECRAEL